MQLIAKQRGMGLFEILSHDLLQFSPIFYFDLPAETDKSRLLAEIEQHLSQNSWSSVNNLETPFELYVKTKINAIIQLQCN